jgi:hypothetical protein
MGLQERLFAISEIKIEDCQFIEEVMTARMLLTRFTCKPAHSRKPITRGWRIVTLYRTSTNQN